MAEQRNHNLIGYIGSASYVTVLALLPLLLAIGRNLEYEYNLLVVIALTLTLPALCLVPVVRRFLNQSSGAGIILWLAIILPLIMAIPGTWLFLIDSCPCSPSAFALWFGLNLVPSWWVMMGLAPLVALVPWPKASTIQRLVSIFCFYILILISLLCDLWFIPQKRTTHLILGFLHGPIYDHYIALDHGVAWMRAAHGGMGLAALVALFIGNRTKILPIVALLAMAAGAFWAGHNYPSQTHGTKALQGYLSEHKAGEGFALHFRKAGSKAEETQVAQVFDAIQFHIQDLKSALPGFKFPLVTVYVYPDDRHKKLWFGGGGTDVTDVYTPSVHINLHAPPHPTLRHELVHALTSDIAFHGLGFHPNMAFTEGMAKALAPQRQVLSLEQAAYDLVGSDRMPDPQLLFSPLFWQFSGQRAYTVAGAIIQFILKQFGSNALARLYQGEHFDTALGLSEDDFVGKWRQYLQDGFATDRYKLETESLFRDPGLFGSRCPHTRGLYIQGEAQTDPYDRWRLPPWLQDGSDYDRWELKIDPGSRPATLRIWRRELRAMMLPLASNDGLEGRFATWIREIQAWRREPAATLEDAEGALLQADLLYLTGSKDKALSLLGQLLQWHQTKSLGDSILRQVHSRLQLAADLNDLDLPTWWRYVAGFNLKLPMVALTSKPWIIEYLELRNQPQRFTEEQLLALANITPPPTLPVTFAQEWHHLLLDQFEKFGRLDLALQQAQRSADLAPTGAQQFWQLEIRRRASLKF